MLRTLAPFLFMCSVFNGVGHEIDDWAWKHTDLKICLEKESSFAISVAITMWLEFVPLSAVHVNLQWKGDVISRHTNDCGNTVLHVCCRGGNLRLAEFLLSECIQQDAELRKIYSDSAVNLLNAAGFTPLMLAASEGMLLFLWKPL